MAVKLTLLDAGYCTHPECVVIQGGRLQARRFPARFGLIEHPKQGILLFDTGYSNRFLTATRQYPFQLYAWLTPVHLQAAETATQQLQQRRISPDAVQWIFISHFHADHIAGLQDFPAARFLYSGAAYQQIKTKTSWSALRHGFIPSLLPDDFEARSLTFSADKKVPLDTAFFPFTEGIDLFQDGSLIAVDLPGHATGHTGLLIQTEDEPYFLVGDACWLSESYQSMRLPNAITKLFFEDTSTYAETLDKLHRLHQFNPEIRIVPSHCSNLPSHWHTLSASAGEGSR